MKFRVQPMPVIVSRDAPFENDRLNRTEATEVLTSLVGSIEGPCVIALDAAWGMGKTTFLRMWQQTLENGGFHVVMFNAWETDFANDPFLALSEELHAALEQQTGGEEHAVAKLKDAARKVLRTAGPAMIRKLALSVVGPAGVDIGEKVLDAFAGESMSQYGLAKTAVIEFREALQAAAGAMSKQAENATPLVVVIDELDRCRPSYAVELLEALKHLFSVDGVVFVLALNRDELVHSVRALYGTGFDAQIYLRRFIDIDLHLPDADRETFIDAKLHSLQGQIQGILPGRAESRRVQDIARDWLLRFFGTPELDLRTVEQALHRLGLMMAMLRDDYDALIKTAAFVLIFRTVEPDLYDRFLGNEVNDEEVANALFDRMEQNFRSTTEGQNLELEIIMAAAEDDLYRGLHVASTGSRLLKTYSELVTERRDKIEQHDADWHHASTLTQFVEHERQKRMHGGANRRFRVTVARLEMLSRDLRHSLPHQSAAS